MTNSERLIELKKLLWQLQGRLSYLEKQSPEVNYKRCNDDLESALAIIGEIKNDT